MFKLKGCGRCKGDLCPQEDMYGVYLKCLQCGRITEEETRDQDKFDTSGRPSQKEAA